VGELHTRATEPVTKAPQIAGLGLRVCRRAEALQLQHPLQQPRRRSVQSHAYLCRSFVLGGGVAYGGRTRNLRSHNPKRDGGSLSHDLDAQRRFRRSDPDRSSELGTPWVQRVGPVDRDPAVEGSRPSVAHGTAALALGRRAPNARMRRSLSQVFAARTHEHLIPNGKAVKSPADNRPRTPNRSRGICYCRLDAKRSRDS
jgi:hypothetical protein